MTSNEFHKNVSEKLQRFHYLLKFANLECKQYQIEGVEFCLRNELIKNISESGVEKKIIRGGIIADEMGLGKTIMMIGLMFSNVLTRTLIVLPPILIQQWYNEIYRITGHKATVYHGPIKKNTTIETLRNSKIVLTSYGAIAISKKDKKLGIIHQVIWGRAIFDEAHHLRNKQTTLFLGCKNIRAGNKWFVTGTPIQNRKQDIYSLYNALGFDAEFYRKEDNMLFLKTNYILSRTKKNVGIILPDVNAKNCLVSWKNKNEKEISEDIHSLLAFSRVNPMKRGTVGNCIMDGGPLIAVLRAKQSCIMPSLMNSLFLKNGIPILKNEDSNGSKVDAVIAKIVSRKENGNGKIVFCHFREEINHISNKLLEEGLHVVTLDGRIKGKKRLQSLQVKADVLILQIQTGCEGLNLQENYSEVYFVSPHWNPAIEDQAIARCHRIGQLKPVNVFKFIMRGFNEKAKEKEKAKDQKEKEKEKEKEKSITLEKYIQHIQSTKRQISEEFLH